MLSVLYLPVRARMVREGLLLAMRKEEHILSVKDERKTVLFMECQRLHMI